MGTNRFYQSSVQNVGEQTNGTTDYININGLSLDLVENDQINFKFMVVFKQSLAQDSIRMNLTFPPPSVIAYEMHVFDASSYNAPLVGTVVPQANTPYVSWVQGYVENGSSPGALQIQFGSAQGLGAVTILNSCNALSRRVSP